eukprot:TRINITY_DN5624_c0_g1_i1.p1 TRINITY_DN5624_c0_g1~~TRINITY_DN5624_c0_g1_i1.p1  ORF type:complete len:830 (-),score=138.19 TRINITY_DN5624_c0_g1_i1:42-2462(-)
MKGENDNHALESRIGDMEQQALKILQNTKPEEENEEALIKMRESARKARKQAREEYHYTGPRLSKKDSQVTEDHVKAFYELFSTDPNKPLPHRIVKNIAVAAYRHYKSVRKSLTRIVVPENGHVTVVGDIHGQLIDLLTILSHTGFPSETQYYVFNGDLVDRGPHGPSVISLVLAMKLAWPDYVHINRGNHEDYSINHKYAFEEQCLALYDGRVMSAITEVYRWLPLCSVINDKVFVVHAGLTMYDDLTLDEIERLPLGVDKVVSHDLKNRTAQICTGLLWSDPVPKVDTWEKSRRGAGVHFGEKMLDSFLRKNNLEFVVRSHEVAEEGFNVMFGGKLVTLFSASYYDGKNTNKAATATFSHGQTNWREPKYFAFTADVFAFTGETVQSHLKEIQKSMASSTIDQISELIFQNRHQLLLKFEEICEKTYGLTPQMLERSLNEKQTSKHKKEVLEREKCIEKGYITETQWIAVMEDVLGLNLDWNVLLPYIVHRKGDGTLSYRKFLARFHPKLSTEGWTDWMQEIISEICLQLHSASISIAKMFEKADSSKNHVLSYAEFIAMMKSFNVNLSDHQLYEFMQALDKDKNGLIDFSELHDRFKLEFQKNQGTSDNQWVEKTINEMARKMYLKHGETKDSWAHLVKKRNYMDSKKFGKVLKKYCGENYTAEEIQTLFDTIDTNKNGIISMSEFKEAFMAKDTKGTAWQYAILQRILGVLLENKIALSRVFKAFDRDNSGLVGPHEFKAGLQALNVFTEDPLTDTQINILHDFIDTDKDGCISYAEFLAVFKIQDHTLGENVKSVESLFEE